MGEQQILPQKKYSEDRIKTENKGYTKIQPLNKNGKYRHPPNKKQEDNGKLP